MSERERAGEILDKIYCPDYGAHRETDRNKELWDYIEQALKEAKQEAYARAVRITRNDCLSVALQVVDNYGDINLEDCARIKNHLYDAFEKYKKEQLGE